MKSDSFVSIVLVVERLNGDIVEAVSDIQSVLHFLYTDYEVLIVAQGGRGRCIETSDLKTILETIPSVRFLQLSSWVEQDVGWAAGLENAIGDFVVLFEAGADPLVAIGETVEICRAGNDVVVGVATNQTASLAYKILRSAADALLRSVDYDLPRDSTGLRCLSRGAVNSVTGMGGASPNTYTYSKSCLHA